MITAPKSAWRYSHEGLNSFPQSFILEPELGGNNSGRREVILLLHEKKVYLKKKISLAVSNVNKRKGMKLNKD
jgi:hypothetical protein